MAEGTAATDGWELVSFFSLDPLVARTSGSCEMVCTCFFNFERRDSLDEAGEGFGSAISSFSSTRGRFSFGPLSSDSSSRGLFGVVASPTIVDIIEDSSFPVDIILIFFVIEAKV